MNLLRAMFSRQYFLATVFVLLGTALCARLGIWQLDRLEQRRAFNAHYLATSQMPTLELDSAPQADLTTMEYRPVTLSGTFDFDHQVALRNRYHENTPGYDLLTPLILSDGTAVLIQRGWIPAEGNAAPADWRKYDQPGVQTIHGILRLGQTRPDLGGIPDPELAPGQTRLDFWNLVNLERLALQIPDPLLPVFVQPDGNPSQTEPPFPSQPTIEITEGPHFGYALQWFTFASILFFGYPFFYLRQALTKTPEPSFPKEL